jgi:hypothetical protein
VADERALAGREKGTRYLAMLRVAVTSRRGDVEETTAGGEVRCHSVPGGEEDNLADTAGGDGIGAAASLNQAVAVAGTEPVCSCARKDRVEVTGWEVVPYNAREGSDNGHVEDRDTVLGPLRTADMAAGAQEEEDAVVLHTGHEVRETEEDNWDLGGHTHR